MRISDLSSDVCSSDLTENAPATGIAVPGVDILVKLIQLGFLGFSVALSLLTFWLLHGVITNDHLTPAQVNAKTKPIYRFMIMTIAMVMLGLVFERSEERRVGKVGVRTCRYRWW